MRVAVPETAGRNCGADQANESEPCDRHAFAGLTVRFGKHRGNRRQGHDDDRNDGGVLSHYLALSRLATGGWRLAFGGWQSPARGLPLALGDRRLAVGGLRLAVG